MPECAASEDSAETPRITAPRLGVTYTLRRSRPANTIGLEANAAADVRTVFWFDGDSLIGKSTLGSGGMPWRPQAEGAQLIRAIDDHGRSAEREIQVQYVD
jgi:penicillin-binding protein 1C